MDPHKDDILNLITQHGPMGVNAIAKELSKPVSTIQKYLHKQSYFKMNDDKKWDLPENVISEIKNTSLVLMANVVENSILLLKSQLDEMLLNVNNTLTPIDTLKRGINQIGVPVASTKFGQNNIDPRLSRIMETNDTLTAVFKRNKQNIPDEYETLIFNFDYVGLVVKEGEEYTNNFLQNGLYELIAGKEKELTEDTVEVLKANQKDDKS